MIILDPEQSFVTPFSLSSANLKRLQYWSATSLLPKSYVTVASVNLSLLSKSVVKNVVNEKGNKGHWVLTTPKTKSSRRTIPIPNQLYNDLKDYYNEQKKQYGFNNRWFVFGDTNPISTFMLRNRKIKYAKEAGVKEIRTHDFRHSCAYLLINSGASIMVVAKYLGHSKIDETLNTYSHLFKNKLSEVVETMNNLS